MRQESCTCQWGLVNNAACGLSFATEKERNYTELLCSRFAKLLAKRFLVGPILKSDQKEKIGTGIQPRRFEAPLVPMHKRVVLVRAGQVIPKPGIAVTVDSARYPNGLKILGESELGRLGPSLHEDFVKAGVCCDTQEFVGRALPAQHPLQAPPVLSPSSTKVIFDSPTKLSLIHH